MKEVIGVMLVIIELIALIVLIVVAVIYIPQTIHNLNEAEKSIDALWELQRIIYEDDKMQFENSRIDFDNITIDSFIGDYNLTYNVSVNPCNDR